MHWNQKPLAEPWRHEGPALCNARQTYTLRIKVNRLEMPWALRWTIYGVLGVMFLSFWSWLWIYHVGQLERDVERLEDLASGYNYLWWRR